MSSLEDNFYFVIYPKKIILKGIYYDSIMPHYSLSIFKGDIKEDQTSAISIRQQQLYQTIFMLQKGQLQFNQTANLHECQQRKIIIYQKDKQMGDFIIRTDQYISNYQDYNSQYYQQKVKLNNGLEFEFQIYMANTLIQLSDLLIQYRGESNIKTPITVSSHLEEDSYSLRQIKEVQSQILSVPRFASREQKESDESLNSEVHLSRHRDLKKSFMINLKSVPGQSPNSAPLRTNKSNQSFLMQQFTSFLRLPLKDKLIFSAFASISLVTIYVSMLPIKKI